MTTETMPWELQPGVDVIPCTLSGLSRKQRYNMVGNVPAAAITISLYEDGGDVVVGRHLDGAGDYVRRFDMFKLGQQLYHGPALRWAPTYDLTYSDYCDFMIIIGYIVDEGHVSLAEDFCRMFSRLTFKTV